MQNYSEPSSRMIRLPAWTEGNVVPGGGTVYSNRQPYLGESFRLNGIPVHNPLNHPPVQVFYPPANNSRLPVFHLMSSAPVRGPTFQGHQQLGLATGIGSSSASTSQMQRKEPVVVTKTLPIPTERRQRKSVIIVRKCNNETDSSRRVVSCAAGSGKGNAPTSKRPRGRPPGKKNKLPTAEVSPLAQSLGTDSFSMAVGGRSNVPASNEIFEQNAQQSAGSSTNHHDQTMFNKISNSHQRCMGLIEYIREKTSDAPERFNKFLNLMKLYRENGPTEQRPIIFENYTTDVLRNKYAMDVGAGLSENTGPKNNSRSDQRLFVEGTCVPNWGHNLPMPNPAVISQQCFQAEAAATQNFLGAEKAEATAEKNELLVEDTNIRENILEVCGSDDEMSITSTSSTDTDSNGEQEQGESFREDEISNDKRIQIAPLSTKKYCKLASDPKLYRLLSAIHLFGAAKNDILVKNNGRNITNEKLEDKLSKLIKSEIDESKWKILLLCTAYPASDKISYPFLCLQQLLRYFDPLPCKDAKESPSKSSDEETANDGSFKVFDYESFDRLDESYYEYPESFVHPNYIGRDENGKKVLNTEYFSVASIISQARTKSDDEQTAEIMEDIRYEFDMLDHACSRAIEELTKFEKKKVVPKDGHRRAVQLIYANDGNVILEGIEKQPELFIPSVLQWIKVKKNEWTELRNRWNVSSNEKLRDMHKHSEEKPDECVCNPDAGESIYLGKVQFC
ncbi:Paired amphipathic helix protein Sin3a, partial [Orchesella cincta]